MVSLRYHGIHSLTLQMGKEATAKLVKSILRPAPSLLLGTRPETSDGYTDAYTPLGAGVARHAQALSSALQASRGVDAQGSTMPS
jgi:hypothetical protein